MQHHRGLLLAVGIHILQVKLGRQAEVQLAGGQGVLCANGGLDVHVQLGAVEGSLADFLGEVDTQLGQYLPQGGFSLLPHGIIGMVLDLILGVPQRQDAAVVGNTEILVDIPDEANYPGHLVLDLVRGDEQMGIVLAEMTATLNALQGAAGFIPEVMGNLTDADGQLPIGVGAVCIDHHVVGAVHGAQDEALAVHFHGGEHIVLIMCPVAGGLIQSHSAHARGHHVLIAQLALLFLNVILQLLPDRIASGQEHGHAPAYQLIGHEQAHFLADLPVVSGLGLLLLLQVLVQFLLGSESNAVDTGKHLVVGIVLPVSAGLLGDLKSLQALGVGQVGADAHIDIVALLVEADDGILGQVADVLLLILGVTVVHELDGLVPGQNEGLDGKIFLADLLHFLLDGGQILVSELGVAQIDVIIEAVLGGWAKGKIRLGVQPLDGLGHDVGGGVAQNVQLLFLRALGHGSVLVDDFHVPILLFAHDANKNAPSHRHIKRDEALNNTPRFHPNWARRPHSQR